MDITSLLDNDSFYIFTLYNNNRPGFDRISFCGVRGVVYGGETFIPLPCEITDLTYTGNSSNEPTLSVADNDGVISRLINNYGIEGSEVAVQRVKRRQLDDGSTPNFNVRPLPEIFKVANLLSKTPEQITYKLKSRISLKQKIPGRSLNNTCIWKRYRGAGCTYQGAAMFTVANQPTTNPDEDICALTKKACDLRGNFQNFSGCPSINQF